MMRIFVTEGDGLREKHKITKGSWVHLVDPGESEKEFVSKKLKVESEVFEYALDDAEKPRLEDEKNYKMIILRAPFRYKDNNTLRTVPFGVMLTDKAIVTISSEELNIFEEFTSGKADFYTNKRTRFIFQIFQLVMRNYIRRLDKLEDDVEKIELELLRSPKNEGILQILQKRKTLVYFNKAITANGRVLERLLSGSFIRLFEEDRELLEDVIIENEQALEMSSTQINVLKDMMDTYSSIVDNNLNAVMRVLTAVTIIMSMPALVGSFWGMNVPVPLGNSTDAFGILLALATALGVATTLVFYKVGWL